jgi:hypothetical protein
MSSSPGTSSKRTTTVAGFIMSLDGQTPSDLFGEPVLGRGGLVISMDHALVWPFPDSNRGVIMSSPVTPPF